MRPAGASYSQCSWKAWCGLALFAQEAEAKGLGWVETLSCKGRGALRSQCGGGGKASRALVQQSALLLGLSQAVLAVQVVHPHPLGAALGAAALRPHRPGGQRTEPTSLTSFPYVLLLCIQCARAPSLLP